MKENSLSEIEKIKCKLSEIEESIAPMYDLLVAMSEHDFRISEKVSIVESSTIQILSRLDGLTICKDLADRLLKETEEMKTVREDFQACLSKLKSNLKT